MNKTSTLKQAILATCINLIDQRINTNMKVLASISESMQAETKSSAGDKFETSRAMLQADQERYKSIIIKAKKARQQLGVLSIEPTDTIREGSLVKTTGATYFIAVGIGKIKDPETVYVISKDSPIGQKLMGQQVSHPISFNNNNFIIESIS